MAGGLDHLVIVAHDLDEQSELYRRLGFLVGARNRHAWGTLNHIVQFEGCFLELLTTEESFERPAAGSPVAQFVDTIADYLGRREGLAMMVLEGFDTDCDHASFNAAGIGYPETFYFARQGRGPDGEAVEVAFSLAFARNATTRDAGFFVCRQHAPELFWNPAFQDHDNGVNGINRVVFVADEPLRQAAFFDAYTGVTCTGLDHGGLRYELARSAIEVMTPDAAGNQFGADALPARLSAPQFAAIEFAVDDVAHAMATLIESDIAFRRVDDLVVVPAGAAMGVTLVFSGTT